jgi:hypothetical protein
MKTDKIEIDATPFFRRGLILLQAFCFALLLSSCAGSDGRSSGANGANAPGVKSTAKRAKIDPCALFTKTEAESALGEAADAGKVTEKDLGATGGTLTVCSYSAANRPIKFTNVSVWQASQTSSAQWNAQIFWGTLKSGSKAISDQRPGGSFETLSGIGQDGYVESWPAGTIGATELHVLNGDLIVGVKVPGQGAAAIDLAKGIASKSLERIGR